MGTSGESIQLKFIVNLNKFVDNFSKKKLFSGFEKKKDSAERPRGDLIPDPLDAQPFDGTRISGLIKRKRKRSKLFSPFPRGWTPLQVAFFLSLLAFVSA